MNKQTHEMIAQLGYAGIVYADAIELRRISMTLHRWHELECGDSNAHNSFCLVRGRKAKRTFTRDPETQAPMWIGGEFTHDDNGTPFLEIHHNSGGVSYVAQVNRERGAQKRLGKIMARYPGLIAYVQGDPRGAALYILRPGDIPEGANVDSCYNRGIAVYK